MAATKNMGTVLENVTDALTIADLTTIGRVGGESTEIEVTTLDSADGYREFIPSLKDAGEVAFSGIIKSETAMEAMLGYFEDQVVRSWKITALNGATWEFEAFVKMFEESEATVEGVRGFAGTLRVSGKSTYTSPVVSA